MGINPTIVTIVIIIPTACLYYHVTKTDPIPHVQDAYWGPKSEQDKKEDVSIHPFKINISQSILDDLNTRLKCELDSNRLVPPFENVGFGYGFNSKFLKKVGDHWLNKYDWRAREKLLNKYPHFKTRIGGLDIHFQHVKPKAKDGIETRPVLILHGYPTSIIMYQKMIPLLSEPKNSKYNYELIIPSLPGFGFSSPAARPLMGSVEMANIFKRLMDRLGHKKFYALGSDWGARIASDLATVYPDKILGVHSSHCVNVDLEGIIKNFLAVTFRFLFAVPEEAEHKWPTWKETVSFMVRETGHLHFQATKPDTLGVALTHSPLGLAAHILEKFSTWTNRTWIDKEDGGILGRFEIDELLDNVMIYWVTGSITTASRLYKDHFLSEVMVNKVPTNVPHDCCAMSGDILVPPKFAISHKFTNIKRYKILKGGFFAPFEIPDVIADDAVSFFNSL